MWTPASEVVCTRFAVDTMTPGVSSLGLDLALVLGFPGGRGARGEQRQARPAVRAQPRRDFQSSRDD